MREKRAISKYMRVQPQKARLAANLIRGRSVEEAVAQLSHSGMKGARMLLKTLNSAVANAEMGLDISRDELRVVEVRVDEGPRLKRSKPKNRGGRHPIIKRTSHLTVVVGAD